MALIGPIVRLLRAERRWLLALLALFTFVRWPYVDGWDEAFYVGQLVSVMADGDLRLQDDVVSIPRRFEERHRILATPLPSGALHNTMSIGPAILLSPFTAGTVRSVHPPPWTAFRMGAAIGALVLLLLTAALCVDALRRLGLPDRHAVLAAGLAMIAGPLAVYGTRSYLVAHATGAFLVALTLQQALALVATRRKTVALGLGMAAGLACVNRWQDVVVVGPLLGVALVSLRTDRAGRPWTQLALVAFGAAPAVACQLLAWQAQFGSPLLVPQGSGYMRWLTPQIIPLLFSSHGGLLPWAPGIALGLLGLTWLAVDRGLGTSTRVAAASRWFAAAMLLGALAAVYVSACAEDWWGRDTFGPRRLTSLVPFAAVGLAFIFSRAGVKTRAALALGLASWGVFLASAHFSRHRDLSLLLFGRPDPWSPDPGQAPPAVRWIDRWGPLHFAKPGFTFSDTPGWTDRLLGLVVVTLVVAATWLVWRGLHRYRAAQSAAVVGAVGLVVAWTVTLAVVPTNSGSNAAWRAFLDAPLDPARAQPLPSDMSQARDVVIAAAASAAGDRQVLADAIRRLNEGGIAVTEAEAAPAAPATRP